ncbi:MAG TPA: hypothetical protein VJS19_07810 [Candidatus Dormibacteraeota bacterium]|nr:hypothetical protein [Candidatus Dormibacteraeota bacterium]
MRRLAILGVAAVAYVLAAWMVAPGFYDGFGPQNPYNWTCPPPQAGANVKPSSGHLVIKVINGRSDANSAFTDDGQIVIGFLPGAFDVTGKTSVTVDITPLPTCPQPKGLKFVTNVYAIVADAPLLDHLVIGGQSVPPANLTLRYSNLEPDPNDVYIADDPSGPWTSIGHASAAAPYTIDTHTNKLGYFVAGYTSSNATPPGVVVGGGPALPIIVAALIVVVVLAGLPLAVLRRRRGGGGEEDE